MSVYEAGVPIEDKRRAREAAHSMFEWRGFSKDDIARIIGAETQYDRLVCMYFVQLFDFAGRGIVSALRLFLSRFSLNAEAQEIDRIMYAFATHYGEQNDSNYSVDALHALSMSILILNTDLHNPNNANRMKMSTFISSLTALNDGADFPRPLLEGIYNDIKSNQILPAGASNGTPDIKNKASSKLSAPFTLQRGRPSSILDTFFLGERLGPATLQETLLVKNERWSYDTRAPKGKRRWKRLHTALCGSYLIFHKPIYEPQSQADCSQNIYDALILRHVFARRALEYTKRDHAFQLTTSTGRRVILIASSINVVAATTSAPPLPTPATSSKASLRRPMLPTSKSSETLEEQVERYRNQLHHLKDQFEEHRDTRRDIALNDRSKLKDWQDRYFYLELELERIATYFDILNEMHLAEDAMTKGLASSMEETAVYDNRRRDRFLGINQHAEAQVSWPKVFLIQVDIIQLFLTMSP
eukprot:gene11261-3307_t